MAERDRLSTGGAVNHPATLTIGTADARPPVEPRAYRLWTIAEEDTLRRLHGRCNMPEIARRMGRSYYSVKNKLADLGLTGGPKLPPRRVPLLTRIRLAIARWIAPRS